MTVSELITWLQTQDQGATVEVVVSEYRDWSRDAGWRTFDPAEHSDYSDMRGNQFAVGKPYENSRTLYLGSC